MNRCTSSTTFAVGVSPVRRPDRLVGYHQLGCGGPIRQRTRKLPATDIERLAGIALPPGLADADDCGHPRAPGGLGLLPHQHIALAMVGAAFGMANDDGAGAGIRQHFR